jgi:hypothetical protein
MSRKKRSAAKSPDCRPFSQVTAADLKHIYLRYTGGANTIGAKSREKLLHCVPKSDRMALSNKVLQSRYIHNCLPYHTLQKLPKIIAGADHPVLR